MVFSSMLAGSHGIRGRISFRWSIGDARDHPPRTPNRQALHDLAESIADRRGPLADHHVLHERSRRTRTPMPCPLQPMDPGLELPRGEPDFDQGVWILKNVLRDALRTYGKRVKPTTKLDHESKPAGSPPSNGQGADFDAVIPPEPVPRPKPGKPWPGEGDWSRPTRSHSSVAIAEPPINLPLHR